MYLKKFYDPDDLARWKAEYQAAFDSAIQSREWGPFPDADEMQAYGNKQAQKANIRPAEIAYISLAHTGVSPEQNFSTRLVTDCLQKGLMSISGDELTFNVHPEPLHYEILRSPGRYCCHCGEKLPNDTGGELARLHVASEHAGIPSPDTNNPAGYVALNHFECRLNAEQHAKWRVMEPARAPHFATKEE